MAKNLIAGDTTTIVENGNDISVELNQDYTDFIDINESLQTTANTLPSAINELKNEVYDTGWVDFSNTATKGTWNHLRVRKIGKMCYVDGDASTIAWSGSGETIASLPDGYRPSSHTYTYAFCTAKNICRIYLGTGGGVGIDWISNMANNGANYTSNTWLRFKANYMVD